MRVIVKRTDPRSAAQKLIRALEDRTNLLGVITRAANCCRCRVGLGLLATGAGVEGGGGGGTDGCGGSDAQSGSH
jgi:hypothetical protein